MSEIPLIKVLIKVLEERSDKLVWEHVCYVPRDVYLDFLRSKNIERFEIADYMSRWARIDFNIDLSMTTMRDLQILKALIRDKYQTVYPYISRNSKTDHQGWTRVWMTQHIEKELKKR